MGSAVNPFMQAFTQARNAAAGPSFEQSWARQIQEPNLSEKVRPEEIVPLTGPVAILEKVFGTLQQKNYEAYQLANEKDLEDKQRMGVTYEYIRNNPNLTQEAKDRAFQMLASTAGRMGLQDLKKLPKESARGEGPNEGSGEGSGKKGPGIRERLTDVFSKMAGADYPRHGKVNVDEVLGQIHSMTLDEKAQKSFYVKQAMGRLKDIRQEMSAAGVPPTGPNIHAALANDKSGVLVMLQEQAPEYYETFLKGAMAGAPSDAIDALIQREANAAYKEIEAPPATSASSGAPARAGASGSTAAPVASPEIPPAPTGASAQVGVESSGAASSGATAAGQNTSSGFGRFGSGILQRVIWKHLGLKEDELQPLTHPMPNPTTGKPYIYAYNKRTGTLQEIGPYYETKTHAFLGYNIGGVPSYVAVDRNSLNTTVLPVQGSAIVPSVAGEGRFQLTREDQAVKDYMDDLQRIDRQVSDQRARILSKDDPIFSKMTEPERRKQMEKVDLWGRQARANAYSQFSPNYRRVTGRDPAPSLKPAGTFTREDILNALRGGKPLPGMTQ